MAKKAVGGLRGKKGVLLTSKSYSQENCFSHLVRVAKFLQSRMKY